MSRARNLADLLDANGDVASGALDNVPPSNDASALTTGTLPVERVPYVGRRNLIINGAMQVAQRGTTGTTNSTSAGYQTVDRFGVQLLVSTGVYSTSIVQDAPSTFDYSHKITVSTADTSLDADQRTCFYQFIEGYNAQNLKWGTSEARDATLSFWVKGSSTGTYGLAVLTQNGSGRTRTFTYTIDTANTWEYKTISIPADTVSSDWFQTTSTGIQLRWSLGCGSNRTQDTGSWVTTGAKFGATGEKNFVAIQDATWQITGVQLEVGSVATPFEHRSYGEELALCQRYYASINLTGVVCVGASSVRAHGTLNFPVEMRAVPSISGTSINRITNFAVIDYNGDYSFSVLNTASKTHASFSYFKVTGDSWATGVPVAVNPTSQSATTTMDAEL
jgi:hypothetical protein